MALPWAPLSALPLPVFEVGDRLFVQGFKWAVAVTSAADGEGWYAAEMEQNPLQVVSDVDMDAGVTFRFKAQAGCVLELETGRIAKWKPVDKNALLHEAVQKCVDASELRPGVTYPTNDDLASKLEAFLRETMLATMDAAKAQGTTDVSKKVVEDAARAVMQRHKRGGN
jgi:hypothetical protein